ncbi:MAG: carboxypeptidase-like regulatory domain-containing protein, partial [Flavobacteriales bacterium]|nr:carboxypeptidase-like regulatory domain-containing protein [Flavobacteriales bacterium]
MTLKHILTICALLLLAPALRAQSGTIQGRLTEGEPGQEQPIPFANVLVAGTTVGTTTDLDGNYQLSVEAGTYAVVFSFVGFGTDTASNVVVRPGEITRLDHGMGSSAIDIEEFEVVQKVDRERETVLLMDR